MSATGGEKEVKLERYSLIPVYPLQQLAILYGRGAEKYSDHNWRRGYEWSKSYDAAMRHLNQFWGGEDFDEETGVLHTVNAAWHCFTLTELRRTIPSYDDRYRK